MGTTYSNDVGYGALVADDEGDFILDDLHTPNAAPSSAYYETAEEWREEDPYDWFESLGNAYPLLRFGYGSFWEYGTYWVSIKRLSAHTWEAFSYVDVPADSPTEDELSEFWRAMSDLGIAERIKADGGPRTFISMSVG